jgi:hypothetical protein
VIELLIVAALSVLVGVAWGLVVRALPQADPARAASQQLSAELAKRRGLRRFLRARLEPETATGLALTFALVGVMIAGVAFGVLAAMIRSNSGVVNVDIAVTRWAAAHATGTSLSVFGWLTQLGGTIGTIVIALATVAYAMRARGHWSIALFVILVVGGESLFANLIKITVGRVRGAVSRFLRSLVSQRSRHGRSGDLGGRRTGARPPDIAAHARDTRRRGRRDRGGRGLHAGVPGRALDV